MKIVIGTVSTTLDTEDRDKARRSIEDAATGDDPKLKWIEENNSTRLEEYRRTPSGLEWCFVGRIYY